MTILTFIYTMDQVYSSMLIKYWTRDYIYNKTHTVLKCLYIYNNNEHDDYKFYI